jgi:hypothetical protein
VEDENLFIKDEEIPQQVETATSEWLTDPALPNEGASGATGQDYLQEVGLTAPGEGTTEEITPVICKIN